MTTEGADYDNFLEYANWSKLTDFTSSEIDFVKFLFRNSDQLQKFGKLEMLFTDVLKYIKEGNPLWVEHTIPTVMLPAKWEGNKNSPPFNWSLNMSDLEKKYKTKRIKIHNVPDTEPPPKLYEWEKDIYEQKSNVNGKFAIVHDKKTLQVVHVGQTKGLTGVMDKSNVYYHELNERYYVPDGTGNYVGYYLHLLLDFIVFNDTQPNGYMQAIKEEPRVKKEKVPYPRCYDFHGVNFEDKLRKGIEEPEPHFHIDDPETK